LINQVYETMEQSINEWYSTCFNLHRKLNDDYEETAAVALEVKGRIELFREHLPLIKCITSEAISSEDWEDIKEAVGQPDQMERDQITVQQFDKFQLHKYYEQIDEIASRAEKKFQLQKKLKSMKEQLKAFNLSLHRYKGVAWVLEDFENINANLDDQIVGTQAMLGSSNMRGKLKNETKSWETKLNQLSETIFEISKCQKTWMYLEPIFASEDIGKTLAQEVAWFKEVDTLWNNTME